MIFFLFIKLYKFGDFADVGCVQNDVASVLPSLLHAGSPFAV